ncbi:hypothetical protein GINT2_000378 [Glugoides intestinalis]
MSLKLVTHDKTFHYDEVLATAILMKLYPDTELIRTRKVEEINSGDIVYDVGGVFDPSNNRYDHHQASFTDTFSENYNIKLSAAGLIFKYYHKQLFAMYDFTENSIIFEEIKEKIYKEFFLPADAIDNGYDCVIGSIKTRNVADVVQGFNVYSDRNDSSKEETKRFMEALSFVSKDLENYLNSVLKDYVVCYEKLLLELKDFKEDFFYTEMKVSMDLIYDIDKKFEKNLKFVIVKNGADFRILTLPTEKGKFHIKYPLHVDWRGYSGNELEKISGIEGCIFVHATGFTGGNKTLEGAMEMCKRSLKKLEE